MTDPSDLATTFLALHHSEHPLLIPNPWDIGSAKILAAEGFKALATTSSGCAAAVGRLDGSVTRDEALAHAKAIAEATDLPVNLDFENGFADTPHEVAANIRLVVETGVAGCSVEDFTGRPGELYELGLARERIAAAKEAAGDALVLTARAEGFLNQQEDLATVIARLQAYQEVGADVLYAPGFTDIDDIEVLVASVDRPVNVLARPTAPTIAELADVGVARVSVGGAFAFAAIGALVEAARELRDDGTYGYSERSAIGNRAARKAFTADG